MCLCIRKRLGVIQGGHSRQHLALKQLQGGTTASAAVGHLVLRAVLLAGRRGVPAADDGDHSLASGLHHGVHQLLGAALKLRHLEDAHGAVPNDGLGLSHRLGVALNGGGAAVQAHEALRDALRQLHAFFDLAILAELGGASEVHRQDDLHIQLLGLLKDLGHDFGALLVVQRGANGHAVLNLQEGVRHAAANDHLVHLVQHVHDQLDLVTDLCTTEDGQHGLGGVVQDLRESLELLAHEIAGALHVETLSNHGAVCTVCSSEGIVAVDVRKFPDGCPECCYLLFVCFDLVALGINSLALLFHVESQVLQKDHAASRGVSARSLHLWPDAVSAESDWLAQLLLQDLGHWGQRVLRNDGAIGAAEVGSKDDGLGALLQHLLDGRQGPVNALCVGDLGGVGLVLWHVEVNAHEHALASNVHIVNAQLGRHGGQ
mmetsp:Transcript_57454/g.136803  ORF Transcript_57454/g.136803 Transcript_57454/m.136803 type:complete len:431 (-) Transcript_57454:58-1350(-)